MVQNILDTLKQLKVPQNSTASLDELIYAVKFLEEKMSVESDFGYGNNEVIDLILMAHVHKTFTVQTLDYL